MSVCLELAEVNLPAADGSLWKLSDNITVCSKLGICPLTSLNFRRSLTSANSRFDFTASTAQVCIMNYELFGCSLTSANSLLRLTRQH